MTTRPRIAIVGLVAALGLSGVDASSARAQSFQILGHLPDPTGTRLGVNVLSGASGVSADGGVVVGDSDSDVGTVAYRWTEADGMETIGDLPGGSEFSVAYGVSADGNVIVGIGAGEEGIGEAFRWTQAGGMIGLGDLPGGMFYSWSTSTSSSGRVVVGWGEGVAGKQAFYWTEKTGMVGIPKTRNADHVSYDGRVIVGERPVFVDQIDSHEAWRWTAETGVVGLGDAEGGVFLSTANGLSADGHVIVGHTSVEQGERAYRWTESEGIVVLPQLNQGQYRSAASCVSASGKIICGGVDGPIRVGYSSDYTAYIWTEEDGVRTLQGLLQSDYGIDFDGFILTGVSDMSPDGLTLVGTGRSKDNEALAWIATLPASFGADPAAASLTGDENTELPAGEDGTPDNSNDNGNGGGGTTTGDPCGMGGPMALGLMTVFFAGCRARRRRPRRGLSR